MICFADSKKYRFVLLQATNHFRKQNILIHNAKLSTVFH